MFILIWVHFHAEANYSNQNLNFEYFLQKYVKKKKKKKR